MGWPPMAYRARLISGDVAVESTSVAPGLTPENSAAMAGAIETTAVLAASGVLPPSRMSRTRTRQVLSARSGSQLSFTLLSMINSVPLVVRVDAAKAGEIGR